MQIKPLGGLIITALLLSGCQESAPPAALSAALPDATPPTPALSTSTTSVASETAAQAAGNPDRNAYFGDLHVHTGLSFDAYVFGVRATPDDAYRYARGEVIKHPAGFEMQLKKPLDFEAVTDHAEYLGMLEAMQDPTSAAGKHPLGVQMRTADSSETRRDAFRELVKYLRGLHEQDDLLDPEVVRAGWETTIAAAEQHNDPGMFTTFIAYEYTASGPEQQNLHRNVIFRGSDAPEAVFTALDSANPELLWGWMDEQRAAGREVLAIPHNPNGSDGLMFELTRADGTPMDAAYVDQRRRNEPLVEVTQVKGTSDTHPVLSPNDEWADFEIMPLRIASTLASDPHGSYVREAYQNGLLMEATAGINPYRFGLIGSSDTHVGAGAYDEANYWSKVGTLDATPQLRGSVPLDKPAADGSRYASGYYKYWSASGLAGVWAEANTREAIYDALRRKETFATSGPRIRLRFFAGDFADTLVNDANALRMAYTRGVPMGADMPPPPGGESPDFFLWALRDPDSAPLQRLQIVKSWVADGTSHEQVFDVACAAGAPDPATRRCADTGATLDLDNCAYDEDTGVNELRELWQDPDFDSGQLAVYYARVLEIPSCRWSTWDAIRAGVSPRPGLQASIQERAWSSPIWYRPQ